MQNSKAGILLEVLRKTTKKLKVSGLRTEMWTRDLQQWIPVKECLQVRYPQTYNGTESLRQLLGVVQTSVKRHASTACNTQLAQLHSFLGLWNCAGCTKEIAINEHPPDADVTFEVMSWKTCHDVTTQLSLLRNNYDVLVVIPVLWRQ